MYEKRLSIRKVILLDLKELLPKIKPEGKKLVMFYLFWEKIVLLTV
jgi:hypothetical protein